jgi:hypothetical protein
LEVKSFGECESLVQTHIPIIDAGLPKRITADIAELTWERLREGGGVEPVVNPMRTTRVSNLIATLRKGHKQTKCVVTECRGRKALLEGRNTRHFPSANGRIGHFVHTTTEVLSAAKRQLIHIAGYESGGTLKSDGPLVEPGIVVIHVSGERVGGAKSRRS